jgi:hypothetical protein
MPFDGTNARGAKAVYVIDRMLEMFDGGKYWVCGMWNRRHPDGNKQRCLLSALRSIRRTEGVSGDRAGHYLANAMHEKYGCRWSIVVFNDTSHDFATIEGTLQRARELAAQDIG